MLLRKESAGQSTFFESGPRLPSFHMLCTGCRGEPLFLFPRPDYNTGSEVAKPSHLHKLLYRIKQLSLAQHTHLRHNILVESREWTYVYEASMK